MVTLYLVRHGETEENRAHILQGLMPGTLTATGKAQAAALRDKLASSGFHFDALLSSDLKRALDTAGIIGKRLNLSVQPLPLLRERDWGCATGARIGTVQLTPPPEGMESIEKMAGRAERFLAYLIRNYDGKSVLAVSHGLFARCIQAVLTGKTIQDIPRMQNAEVRKLSIEEIPHPGISDSDIVSAD